MRLTTDPIRPVFADLESQSAADLSAVGGRHYAAHESTRLLTCVVAIDGIYHVWIPVYRDAPPLFSVPWPVGFGEARPIELHFGSVLPLPIFDALCDGRTFVAHNAAGFDAYVWETHYPAPDAWYDTVHAARAAGLPGKLDELGKRFFGRGKDKGSEILKKLWKLEREGNEWVNKNTAKPGYVSCVATYNIADVVILERVYQETLSYGESDVIAAHHEVNQRGVAFDCELAKVLIELSNHCTESAADEVSRITGGKLHAGNLKSGPQVKKWLAEQTGKFWKTLDRRFVDRLLLDPDGTISELLEAEDDG